MSRSPRRIQHLRPRVSNPPAPTYKVGLCFVGQRADKIYEYKTEKAAVAKFEASVAEAEASNDPRFDGSEIYLQNAGREIIRQYFKPRRKSTKRWANPSSGQPFVEPDFYLIKSDITPYISDQPKYVVSAHEVYLVDLARHVYIASMTPSIEGEFLYTTCEVDSRCFDLPDRAQDRALELIGEYESELQSYTEPVTYFNARTVQAMTASPAFGYKVKLWPSTLAELRSGEITYEEVVADLCAEYRSNHHL